jgi:hypothetical protein
MTAWRVSRYVPPAGPLHGEFYFTRDGGPEFLVDEQIVAVTGPAELSETLDRLYLNWEGRAQ